MKLKSVYPAHWTMAALILILITSGCGNIPSAPTESAVAPSPVASAVPSLESAEPTATAAPVLDANVLYQDNFTNPATGWSADKFDNYFIGYHEPEYYHIEVTSPNSKTT